MLVLGTLVSWGEIGVLAAGIAGISALFGDRFGALLGFLSFLPLYVAVKYSFLATPAGLPAEASSALGLWLLIPATVAMALAGLSLEFDSEDREQGEAVEGSEREYKPWRI